MFVTKPRLFLKYVFENRFAVPSFNVSNLEMARAVVEAAVLEDAPVMVQTDFINFNYGGMDELYALVRTLAEPVTVPVLLHQDHPGEDHNILRSLRRGYYSVMYDGGHLPLAEIFVKRRVLRKSFMPLAPTWNLKLACSEGNIRVDSPSDAVRRKR